MGTRGLFFVRYRGRYFVYYNHFDSYPEGIGESLVSGIPENPEKYQEWLESMRKTYSSLVKQFEEQHLPVTVESNQKSRELTPSEEHTKCFLAVDDRLSCPPTQTLEGNTLDLFIEFTYIIDLDRECLIVDDGAIFQLSKVPRKGKWIDYLGVDNYGRRILNPHTPSDIIGTVTPTPEVDSKARFRYTELHMQMRSPRTTINSQCAPRQSFLATTYQATREIYGKVLDRFVVGWKPEDFPFREIAFALLSLAAGEVSFECIDVLDKNYQSEGYFLIPDEKLHDNLPKLLPKFLGESHLPGVEPGSAPPSTTFWFGNVLVSLASRLDLVDIEEASVAAVVDAGLSQGLTNFHGMVFSLLDVILIQVLMEKDGNVHVERSPLMNLFYFDDTNSRYSGGPRSRNPDSAQTSDKIPEYPIDSNCDNDSSHERSPSAELKDQGQEHYEEEQEEGEESDDEDYDPDEDDDDDDDDESDEEFVYYELDDDEKSPLESRAAKVQRKERATFVAMMNFFDAATNKHLAGAKSHLLPNEILNVIMEFSDTQTYHALAKVSPSCRDTSYRKYRLNNDYTIVGMGEENPKKFVLETRHSGDKIHSVCDYVIRQPGTRRNKDKLTLSPVLGLADMVRLSVMDSVHIEMSNILQEEPRYPKTRRYPSGDQYDWCTSPLDGDPKDLVFSIPHYAYPGFVEKAWGKYVSSILTASNSYFSPVHINGPMSVNGGTFRCLLPPRQRNLVIEPRWCNEIQILVRHVGDELPGGWETMQGYAIHQFSNRESLMSRFAKLYGEPQGIFVIMAFGTKVRLFYYVYHKPSPPPVPLGPNSYSRQIFASITDPDPKNRLTPLTPENETLDLHDSEAREKVEAWIKLFGKRHDKAMEYDPISEQYIPYQDFQALEEIARGKKKQDVADTVSSQTGV